MRRLSTATINHALTSLRAIRDHLNKQGIHNPIIEDTIIYIKDEIQPTNTIKSHSIPKGMNTTLGKQ